MVPWRFIDSGPGSGTWNLALDEAIFRLVRDGKSPPTVRFYAWSSPTLSLGFAQDRDRTVRLSVCRERGIRVVRRITGGRAVLHDAEVTYSVTSGPAPGFFGTGVLAAYSRIAAALVAGMHRLGLAEATVTPGGRGEDRRSRSPACFASRNRYELAAGGKKLVGSAQHRDRRSFLQQGSILLAGHAAALQSLLREEWFPAPGEEMAGLGDFLQPCPSYAVVVAAMEAGFSAAWDLGFSREGPTMEELSLAVAMERTKYVVEEWNAHGRR